MVKICKVIQNNQYVTVVRFNGMEIQFPSIKRETDTVKVLAKDGKYTIVADDYVEKELKEEKVEKKSQTKPATKKRNKKTTNKNAEK